MSRLARVMVLVLALVSASVATAEAVTWHNTGDTAFTAFSGQLVWGPSGTAEGSICAPTTSTATVGATPATATLWSAIAITTTYDCHLGLGGYVWECSRTFTAQAQSGGTITGIAGTTCVMSGGGMNFCHAQGTQTASYVNPSGATPGRLLIGHANALHATTLSPGIQCLYAGNPPLTMNAQTYTIATATGGPAPHLGPIITRTA